MSLPDIPPDVYAPLVKNDPRTAPPRYVTTQPNGRMSREQEAVLQAAWEYVHVHPRGKEAHRAKLVDSVRILTEAEDVTRNALSAALVTEQLSLDGLRPSMVVARLMNSIDAANIVPDELAVIDAAKATFPSRSSFESRAAEPHELERAVHELDMRPQRQAAALALSQSTAAERARRLIASYDHAMTISNTPLSHLDGGADFDGAEITFRYGGEDEAEHSVFVHLTKNPQLRQVAEFASFYEQLDMATAAKRFTPDTSVGVEGIGL